MFDLKNDGIDHINIYSKGQTELGKLLSNFANTPFTLKDDGSFSSLEGYWFWLLTDDPNKDALRTMFGFEAKEFGSKLPLNIEYKKDDKFKSKIYTAIMAKFEQNPRIKELLEESKLPFDHYYAYEEKMVRTKYDWLVKFFEKARMEIKYSPEPKDVDLF